jgi:hypothetical protein
MEANNCPDKDAIVATFVCCLCVKLSPAVMTQSDPMGACSREPKYGVSTQETC